LKCTHALIDKKGNVNNTFKNPLLSGKEKAIHKAPPKQSTKLHLVTYDLIEIEM
jgi:hypothetical protein